MVYLPTEYVLGMLTIHEAARISTLWLTHKAGIKQEEREARKGVTLLLPYPDPPKGFQFENHHGRFLPKFV